MRTGLLSGLSGWSVLCLLAAAGSLLAWALPSAALDWQPALALRQPWRLVSAAWVHWSGLHLAANLSGLILVAWLGHAAQADRRSAVAWALAWPLTQAALWAQPTLGHHGGLSDGLLHHGGLPDVLLHYGGLSGVLHAAVAVLVVQLLWRERGARRAVGGALGLGLLAKVVMEAPWGPALRLVPGWDLPVVPFAHLAGAVAGGGVAAALQVLRADPDPPATAGPRPRP